MSHSRCPTDPVWYLPPVCFHSFWWRLLPLQLHLLLQGRLGSGIPSRPGTTSLHSLKPYSSQPEPIPAYWCPLSLCLPFLCSHHCRRDPRRQPYLLSPMSFHPSSPQALLQPFIFPLLCLSLGAFISLASHWVSSIPVHSSDSSVGKEFAAVQEILIWFLGQEDPLEKG